MPYIPKPKRHTSPRTDNYKKRRRVYQSQQWVNLRNAHIAAHPLCYVCERMGIINGSDIDVHHIKHLENYEGIELQQIAFDPSNLLSCCKYHHSMLHTQWKYIDTLEGIDKAIDNLNRNKGRKL